LDGNRYNKGKKIDNTNFRSREGTVQRGEKVIEATLKSVYRKVLEPGWDLSKELEKRYQSALHPSLVIGSRSESYSNLRMDDGRGSDSVPVLSERALCAFSEMNGPYHYLRLPNSQGTQGPILKDE